MNPLYLSMAVPIFGAFVLLAAPKRSQGRFFVSVLGATFIFCVLVAFKVLESGELKIFHSLTDWFALSFTADGIGALMAGISSFVALLIGIYSLEYMAGYENNDDFFFWVLLFVGSMMGLVFAANLLLVFCFWEMTSVCSWRLIGFYGREKDSKAADKAFLATFFGASLMLAGVVMVFLGYGTLELSSLKGQLIPNLAAFLILAGIISKSAQLPLQSWLPDAGVAPTPVTALLHAAVLVKIGIFVFARLFCLTFVACAQFYLLAVVMSIATIIVGAGCALVENNMKRILAYSTISQLGYILFALSLNTDISLKLAMLYILAHSLAKAGLFLCAGIVEHKTGSKDINELGGLAKTMPLVAAAYLLCALSVVGIPPFLGFWPKFFLVILSFKSGYLMAGVLLVVGALFTLFYLIRLFSKVFLGQVNKAPQDPGEGAIMSWIVMALGILSVLLGLYFRLPFGLVTSLIK